MHVVLAQRMLSIHAKYAWWLKIPLLPVPLGSFLGMSIHSQLAMCVWTLWVMHSWAINVVSAHLRSFGVCRVEPTPFPGWDISVLRRMCNLSALTWGRSLIASTSSACGTLQVLWEDARGGEQTCSSSFGDFWIKNRGRRSKSELFVNG